MSDLTRHDDFGEKIGGARKDLWKERGLLAGDLSHMNSGEAYKYVTKDNIWKKPDYQAMIEGGLPPDVVYFIKTIRDALSVNPVYSDTRNGYKSPLERQEAYIDTVRAVQDAVMSVETKADAMALFSRFLVDGGYVKSVQGRTHRSYERTEKGAADPTLTQKLIEAFYHTSTERGFERKITQKAASEQFGVSKEEKIPRGYDIKFNDGKHTYSVNNDWKSDTWFVTKGYRILQTNFETRDEALKWVQDFTRERAQDGRKQRFTPPQLEHIRREGSDYRGGKDADGQDYLNTFGFKGGEFGNWMSQNDRRASLNYGFDALKDLAAVLGVSDRDISFQGRLSIAFGARGGGKAIAHYEPLHQVINLTKMNGAGSLAHEWWHALDHFMGVKMNSKGFLSESPPAFPLVRKLMHVIKRRTATPEEAAAQAKIANAQLIRGAEGWMKTLVYPYVEKSGQDVLSQYESLKSAYLRGEDGIVDKISAFRKFLTGRVIPKEDRERMGMYERMLRQSIERVEPEPCWVETDYYRNSKQMGRLYEKDGDYWDSAVELTARAFATYVMDKLPGRSDYLAGHAESAVNLGVDKNGKLEIIKAYPESAERQAINAVFDEIIEELKLQNIFTQVEPVSFENTLPESETPDAKLPAFSDLSKHTQMNLSDLPTVKDRIAAGQAEIKARDAVRQSVKTRESKRSKVSEEDI